MIQPHSCESPSCDWCCYRETKIAGESYVIPDTGSCWLFLFPFTDNSLSTFFKVEGKLIKFVSCMIPFLIFYLFHCRKLTTLRQYVSMMYQLAHNQAVIRRTSSASSVIRSSFSSILPLTDTTVSSTQYSTVFAYVFGNTTISTVPVISSNFTNAIS